MTCCFFTFLQKRYEQIIDFNLFEKSFKFFHPDIPLIVFKDKEIEELISSTEGKANMFKIKAVAAKTLYNDYDLVVNIDADHIIFSRLDEILENDYDVAAPSNFNLYENVSISLTSYLNKNYNIVPPEYYVQAGLIASSNKNFWNTYCAASLRHAHGLTCADNDILNLVLHFSDFKFKLLDNGWTPDSHSRKSFYGCSSLNLESKCKITNGIPCINGIPLKCYHVARGSQKPKFEELFNREIVDWLYEKIKF